MKRAAIDIGSNTVQFIIVDANDKQLVRKQFVTSLGKNLDKNGRFEEESMKLTFEALSECSMDLKDHGVLATNFMMTATEASRRATNAADFYQKVEKKLGLKVKIINGDEEAFFCAKGVNQKSSNYPNEYLIIDIGGASTELTLVQKNPFEIIKSISLKIGSVRLHDWTEDGVAKSKCEEVFSQIIDLYKGRYCIGVAGTFTSSATMVQKLNQYSDDKVQDYHLGKNQISELNLRMQHKSIQEIKEEFPFLGKRAEVIQAGGRLVQMLFEKLSVETITMTTKTILHGIIPEKN